MKLMTKTLEKRFAHVGSLDISRIHAEKQGKICQIC